MKQSRENLILIFIYLLGMTWFILNRYFGVDMVLCPTRLLFHVPCPGCGMTRALNLLLGGDVAGAVTMNPNVVIVVPIMFLAPLLLGVEMASKRPVIEQANRMLSRKWFLIPFALFELGVWGYNICRGI